MQREKPSERTLVVADDGEEQRVVTVVEGESLALFERSCGPVTWAAYGTPAHGHKVLCQKRACAQALAVGEGQVAGALEAFFAAEEEPRLLSDLMDLLDKAGESYRYMAWSGEGDVVFRPEGELVLA